MVKSEEVETQVGECQRTGVVLGSRALVSLPPKRKAGGASTNQELTPRALILVATPGRTEVDRRAERERELEREERASSTTYYRTTLQCKLHV